MPGTKQMAANEDGHDRQPEPPTGDQQVDAALVQRALTGDSQAIAGLIERYHGLIQAYVGHLLERNPAADDVVQETFLIVMRELPGLRQPERFATWIKSIAWRECRNWVRHQQVRRRAADHLVRAAWMPAETCEDLDDASGDEPWLVHLAAKIEAMSDGKRMVLILFYLDDLPLERISRFLDLPLGTVKRRLFDARSDLTATVADAAGMALEERRRFCQTLLDILARHRGDASPPEHPFSPGKPAP